jgi:tRNA dimethylallyltransferase
MPGAPLLAIVGPTASGKTEAAIAVAEAFGAEIVSVDSMLVYRGMDVGTAKPTAEERARIPHHLIDVADPSEPFSVARYQRLALAAVRDVRERGSRALLAGGSGLYFRAVVDELEFPGTDPSTRAALEGEAAAVGADALHARLAELDPVAAGRIPPENVRRTIRALEVATVTGRPFSSFAEAWGRFEPERVRAAGVEIQRAVLAERIERRVRDMLERGLLDEVAALVRRGFGAWLTASQAIGYAEFARHLAGEMTLAEAVGSTVKRTKELARRQMVWFRRDPRIRWFPGGADGAGALVDRLVGYLDG